MQQAEAIRSGSTSVCPGLRYAGCEMLDDVGLVATAILIMLLAISSNRALRMLGPERWKALQRWSYVATAATALHAAVYQLLDRRAWPFVAACWILFGLILTFQYAARRKRLATRGQHLRDPP